MCEGIALIERKKGVQLGNPAMCMSCAAERHIYYPINKRVLLYAEP